MMSAWEVRRLSEVVERFIDYRGRTPRKTTSGIPLITAKIVKGGFIQEPDEFIAEGDYDSWMTRGLPQKGDVVLTTEAPLGEIAQIQTEERVALAQRIITLRGKKGILDNTFLKFALQSPVMQRRLHARASGSTVQGIKNSELQEVSIDLPPFPVQCRIGDVLGAIDSKVECNRRINQTLEKMAQALYKHWFVDFRMSQNIEFVQSELGLIPQGWRVGRLDELLVLQRGFDLPSSQRTDGQFPVMSASGQTGAHDDYRVNGPGVVTGRSGVLGKVFFVHQNFWPLNTSLWVKDFKVSRPAHAYHLLRTLNLEAFNAGSAVPTLNRNHVHDVRVVIPPQSIVDIYEEKVMPMFTLRYANHKESELLASTRDYLLPKLLSGEIEVKAAEQYVEAVL